MTAVPSSPCIGLCVIDEPSGLCAGCHRTLAEIAAWGTLGDAERRAIMRCLDARRMQREAPASGP